MTNILNNRIEAYVYKLVNLENALAGKLSQAQFSTIAGFLAHYAYTKATQGVYAKKAFASYVVNTIYKIDDIASDSRKSSIYNRINATLFLYTQHINTFKDITLDKAAPQAFIKQAESVLAEYVSLNDILRKQKDVANSKTDKPKKQPKSESESESESKSENPAKVNVFELLEQATAEYVALIKKAEKINVEKTLMTTNPVMQALQVMFDKKAGLSLDKAK